MISALSCEADVKRSIHSFSELTVIHYEYCRLGGMFYLSQDLAFMREHGNHFTEPVGDWLVHCKVYIVMCLLSTKLYK